jgi:hypothetical protein
MRKTLCDNSSRVFLETEKPMKTTIYIYVQCEHFQTLLSRSRQQELTYFPLVGEQGLGPG